jgi:hypothetical protein
MNLLACAGVRGSVGGSRVAASTSKALHMKPGMGTLLFGIALLVGGIAVTALSGAVVWYGGIIVGGINIVRGLIQLSRNEG